MKNIDFTEEKARSKFGSLESEDTISFQTEIPKPIQQAMKAYIEKHPNWDQYRLLQAALAGFLIQNGIQFQIDNVFILEICLDLILLNYFFLELFEEL